MNMRVGVSLKSVYSPGDVREGAQWMVERARYAADAGLDSLFVGDHHNVPVPYYQNVPILGRLLAEWDDRPAGALFLLPLWHPVLVAEQIGTLASIARGPFVMQCAIGGGDDQFRVFGTTLRARAKRFEAALEIIRASTREQHRLIDEVHDLSCITAGCFTLEKALVPSLAALVHGEVDAIRPVASARRVRVESFIDSGASALEGDAGRMRQVIHNLLAHALACTQTGGNVIVECHGRGEFAEVVVRDNGAGIAADTLAHLFDTGWQMQHARSDGARSPGVWLGLAVVHRIVELHGGRIYATSDGHGMGAVFTVRLPLQLATAKLPGASDDVVSGPFRSSGRIFPKRPAQPSTSRK